MAAREASTDPRGGYWRSLEELAGRPEFSRHLAAEFPDAADVRQDGLSRRRFLQLMSASLALAGLAGCRWPEEKIVPFAHRPEGYVPGETRQFATSLEIAGVAAGLLVTSYDGRPIKVEGNPEHPCSLGAADVFAQASILELYDPDRSQTVVQRSGHQVLNQDWEAFAVFAKQHFAELEPQKGQGLAVLVEATTSPSVARLREELLARMPQTRWYEYEAVSTDSEREGTVMAFSEPHRVRLDLSGARAIVAFDVDLLRGHPTALHNARQLARSRHPDAEQMSRLYAFESGYSLTGVMADHRFPTPTCQVPIVAACLAAELFLNQDLALPPNTGYVAHLLRPFLDHPLRPAATAAVARDLLASRGASLLAAGPTQPPFAHALCFLMNAALENVGRTVHLRADPELRPYHHRAMGNLVYRMSRGQVTTLLILGGNPAYDAPGNLPGGVSFAEALGKVGTSIHLSLYRNETSRACTWHLPRAHALEAWSDLRNPDGSLAAAQPLIEPLYGGRTPAELLSLLLEQPARTAHDLVRRAFHQETGGRGEVPADDPDFEARWQAFLRAGWLAGSAAPEVPARFRSPLVGPNLTKGLQEAQELGRVRLDRNNLELVFAPDGKLFDGRFANNAWLQELPDFLTKLTWDNAALLGPATAAALGVGQGDVVRLQWEGRQAELPVYVLPGQAAWSVTVLLGYGRTAAGRVGDGVGVDVNGLRHGLKFWGGPGLRLTRSGRRHNLACTQDHHAIDTLGADERRQRIGPLVREADLAEYREHPDFAVHLGPHHPPLVSLWQERRSEGHRWGMAIDLNSCIGCNACVVACQAENNIPVVGKKQVGKGREMQWLRLDRYFRGEPENPRVAHQPVACVQCENAPCEQVCPVAATVHSEEGLNVMVYNRCVGTRYCSNNCPYKVRRFNFFNYQKHLTETQKMAYNPEVTVRSRGVMEKCTYCVQRIQKAKIRAKNERRILGDGEIVPACAQTCPTQAIVFGDLNDPASRVAGLQAEQRAYRMLAELNVKPRTAYLARVRNPNPELATAAGEDAGGDADHH